MKDRILLIDSNALVHRAYHALPGLTTKKGQPIGAAYGFFLMFLKAAAELNPKYVVFAFDTPQPTFRHSLYTEYKATRQKADDDLISQFPVIKDLISTFNLPIFEMPGFEADDIVGTIARRCEKEDFEVIILTGDLDELQLVDQNTEVYTMKRGFTDTVIYDLKAVQEKYGFGPDEFVDYKALRGDPSDNIPGVPGIGEKTATGLIINYKSLDNIYDVLEKDELNVSDRVKNTLSENKGQAYMSKKLAQIDTNLELDFDKNSAILGNFDRGKVVQKFQDFEFKSLLPKIPKNIKEEGQPEKVKPATFLCHKVTTQEDAANILSKAKEYGHIVFDVETSKLDRMDSIIVGISFAFSANEGYFFHFSNNFKFADIKEKLQVVLTDPKILKVAHNLKYDMSVLKTHGIDVAEPFFDTFVAAYLISPGDRRYSLDDLSFMEFGYEKIPIEELIGKGKNQKLLTECNGDDLCRYSCEDSVMTFKLYEKYSKRLKKLGLSNVWEKIELPLIPVLSDMELTGIKIDEKFLSVMSDDFKIRIAMLEKDIYKAAGEKFNINSPIQLKKILFDKLKIHEEIDKKTLKKVKTGGYSTAASELEKLKGSHEIIDHIMEYRELAKLKSTYIDALPKLVDKRTGRIHTNYNQTITATGRLSSSDPNLQNIPIRTEIGRQIREAFIPDKGNVILSADYSQIELRLMAHIARDQRMIEAFKRGEDIHTRTASEISDIPLIKVTKEQRRSAKTINFGIIYGMSPHGLSQALGITHEESKSYIDKYFEIHSGIKAYMENIVVEAQGKGYLETIFGRRRAIPEINSSNFMVRQGAERMAINFPMQGTAADIMKLAMIEVNKKIKDDEGIKVIMQVHDELVFEVREEKLKSAAEEIKETMESVCMIDVPIVVNVSFGYNWGELKPLTGLTQDDAAIQDEKR
ncbi:MAG: polymerase I protein [candidate division CPR2 bacterium GW2011_GWC2_39_10]|uniref:DNA polymerase I n=1 Tax=candidate division CPR2 bacterium GW2011_GWC2_39_10 TaxID=1618345 RepID=A0A0G0LZ34_UNCC2|nr:MAG: polymerase I protein [candidate division CPR2 bacterium GW2011_GWC2_39_10]